MQSLTCSLSVLPLDSHYSLSLYFFSFFFNDTATTEIYTLSLHDALPISPAMRMYIARRFLHGLLVLWLVSLVIFSLVRILPGDAVIMQLDQAAAPTPEILSRARQELGLERPFLVQYRSWIASAMQGDLGRSLITRRPVTQELLKRINLTSHLAVMSIIVAMLIALPIGVLSAVRQDTV